MAGRIAATVIGVVFGAILCWSGMSNPDVIRGALLLEQSYLFLFFGSAVLVGALGTELLRRRRGRALLADAPLAWSRELPARRHIVGSAVFGVGWGIADACPGPVATQIGQAIPWAVCTLAGIVIGVLLFQRTSPIGETEPATERPRPGDSAAHIAIAPGGLRAHTRSTLLKQH